MRRRDHYPGIRPEVPDRVGQDRRGQRRGEHHAEARPPAPPRCRGRRRRSWSPASKPTTTPRGAASGRSGSARARPPPAHHRAVHPVGPGAQRAPQPGGAELQTSREPVGDLPGLPRRPTSAAAGLVSGRGPLRTRPRAVQRISDSALLSLVHDPGGRRSTLRSRAEAGDHLREQVPIRSAAARPLETSSWFSRVFCRWPPRLVTRERPRTSRPLSRAAMASSVGRHADEVAADGAGHP